MEGTPFKTIGEGPDQNFHFELFERAPLGGTKAFYRMSKLVFVQKLLHFEVCDFLVADLL